MIARHETHQDKTDLWARLAAPLPAGVVSWRQDGKPVTRDGKYFARFVAYIEANTVRERLDSVVPGEWDLTLELLPPLALSADDEPQSCSFKARLQILGVIREDVGTGKDYKQAATDAFKRAGVRFGIGHELYAYEMNWVQVDSDSKYAKPVEDAQEAYNRRYAGRPGVVGVTAVAPAPLAQQPTMAATNGGGSSSDRRGGAEPGPGAAHPRPTAPAAQPQAQQPAAPAGAAPARQPGEEEEVPSCPKCSGRMWDNRATKRNPKAPDFKCRDRSCDGVIWPPKPAPAAAAAKAPAKSAHDVGYIKGLDDPPAADSAPVASGTDDIPF